MSSGSDTGVHTFEVAESNTIYVGRVIALRADQVVMPGGRVAVREAVEHLGAVAVVALDDQDRVAMIRQYRHAVRDRLWELPAGLLDVAGEDPATTASRELAEEAGLAARDWSVLVDVLSSPGFSDESVRVYLAGGLSEVARPERPEDEEAELQLRWTPLVDAVRQALSGEIGNSVAVAGVLAAHAVRTGVAQPRPSDAPWRYRATAFAARKRP